MSSILEILNIDELKIRKNNLLYQLERIDNELKKRENNKEVNQKLDDHVSCDHVSCDHNSSCDHVSCDHVSCDHVSCDHNSSCDHVSCEKDLRNIDEKPKIMKIKIKKKEQSS